MKCCELPTTRIYFRTGNSENEGVYAFGYTAKNRVIQFQNFMYENSYVYLERKYIPILNHLKPLREKKWCPVEDVLLLSLIHTTAEELKILFPDKRPKDAFYRRWKLGRKQLG